MQHKYTTNIQSILACNIQVKWFDSRHLVIAYNVPKTPFTKYHSKVIINFFAITSIKNENLKQNEKFQKYL